MLTNAKHDMLTQRRELLTHQRVAYDGFQNQLYDIKVSNRFDKLEEFVLPSRLPPLRRSVSAQQGPSNGCHSDSSGHNKHVELIQQSESVKTYSQLKPSR